MEKWQRGIHLDITIAKNFSAEGFQQYFMPPQTQNILQNVDPQTGFSNTAFWDYLPFLDGVYEGQNQHSHP
jgi:hypothetical protein